MARFYLALLFAAATRAVRLNGRNETECERCEDEAHGFASLNGGTVGGQGGSVVTATTHEELKRYAAASEPLIIRVSGQIQSEPLGYEIPITSDKTIIGVGGDARLIGGGFHINQASNIIVRNMQVSDTAKEDDWFGKSDDWDGIQVDNSTNIWIDHMKFARMLDGLVDLRRDSNYVTVSNTIFSQHNKAFGIGWTQNVEARVTVNDCWFNGTHARNPSADNLDMFHLYNNYFSNLTSYGAYSRGHTRMLAERNYFENVHDPLVAGPNSTIRSNWNKFKHCTGEIMENVRDDETFDAADYYEYTLRDPYDVPNDIQYGAGPKEEIGS